MEHYIMIRETNDCFAKKLTVHQIRADARQIIITRQKIMKHNLNCSIDILRLHQTMHN